MSSDLSQEQRLLSTASQVLIAGVAVSFALWWASSVMVPLVMALLGVYVVAPVVDFIQLRLRTGRAVALTLAFALFSLGGGVLTLLVMSSLASLAEHGDVYAAGIDMVCSDLVALADTASGLVGVEIMAPHMQELPEIVSGIGAENLLSAIGMGATNLLGLLTSFMTNATLVVMFVAIIVAGRQPKEGHDGLWGEIDEDVQAYLGTKFIASLATGVLTWFFLWILGVPLSMVFGLLAFFLNFIPSVGSLIAMVLPLPVAYLTHVDQPHIWILAIVLPGLVQFVIGNIIEPRMQGDSLDLHPITVLLALVFWSLLWGIAGAIISVPITAVLKMVLQRFETTRPFAELLAGRIPG